MHRSTIVIMLFYVCGGVTGCIRSADRLHGQQAPVIAPTTAPASQADVQPQAMSLLDEPLFAPGLPPDVRLKREEQLHEAQIAYDRDLHDEDAIIWLGRRQAYLGDYRAAIDTFSNGLALMPESVRLLRHRGHRYITLREFDRALADLSRAAELIEVGGREDEVEPDGQPNARNTPTSTTHTNVFYHLGLAHYLKGEWPEAMRAFGRCFDIARNDDMRVAAGYWLYLSLMRAAMREHADGVLTSISPAMDIIENHAYHRLLLVLKGEIDENGLQPAGGAANDVTIDQATMGYGLGMRDLLLGDSASAERRFREVIASTNWAAFGHIAAEAEVTGHRNVAATE